VTASLADVHEATASYLDLEAGEEHFVVAALATAVSKELTDEEPLWVFLIGPPGGGKTEAIRLLDLVANKRVDELTRAGLLAWAPGKKVRKVGLLTRIPSVALVTISDFSTVATMGDREARARMYGMLRVVYDGRVYRGIGGEPGTEGEREELEWSGHLTLLAGATPAMDAHTSVEAALGERWLTVRLPESSVSRARRRALFVVDRTDVPPLREQAQELVRELVLDARNRIPGQLDREHIERLVDAATFVAWARTGVGFEGQGRNRIPVGLPIAEEPTRLVGQLHRLTRCTVALGLDATAATDLAVAASLDSVPLARMRALHAVARAECRGATVTDVHRGLGCGNRWAAIWELDALTAIGLVVMDGPSRDEDPQATRRYRLADEWRGVYENVALPRTPLSLREEDTGSALRIRTPQSHERTLDEALRDPALFAVHITPYATLAEQDEGNRSGTPPALAGSDLVSPDSPREEATLA
jgi:hypothetical protein